MKNNITELINLIEIIDSSLLVSFFTIFISFIALVISIKTYNHSKRISIENNFYRNRLNKQVQFNKYRSLLNKSKRKYEIIINNFNQLSSENIHKLSLLFLNNDNKKRIIKEHEFNELGHLTIWLIDSIADKQKKYYHQTPEYLYYHLSSIRDINKNNYLTFKNTFISNHDATKIYEIINAIDKDNLSKMYDEFISLYSNVVNFLTQNNIKLKKVINKLETSMNENKHDEFKLFENQQLYIQYIDFLNQLKYISKLNAHFLYKKDEYLTPFIVVEIIYFCVTLEIIHRQSLN